MKRKIIALLLAFVLPLTSVNFVGNAYGKNFSHYNSDYIEYLINKEKLKNRENDNINKKELEKEIKKLEKNLKSASKELEKKEKLSFWQKAKNIFTNASSAAVGLTLFALLSIPVYKILCVTVDPDFAKIFIKFISDRIVIVINNKD